MFGPKMYVHEAPIAVGALAGGLIGSSGAVAGLTVLGGMALGALGGSLLSSLKSPKMPQAQNQQSNAAAQTPALPPATAMPAVPNTPTATPEINAGDASTPTTNEIAQGELNNKRRGRLSTILTSPQSRLQDGQDQSFERLGG